MDHLSCKMQAHVRVCKENKLEGKNYCLLKNFDWKIDRKILRRKSKEIDFSVITGDDAYRIRY